MTSEVAFKLTGATALLSPPYANQVAMKSTAANTWSVFKNNLPYILLFAAAITAVLTGLGMIGAIGGLLIGTVLLAYPLYKVFNDLAETFAKGGLEFPSKEVFQASPALVGEERTSEPSPEPNTTLTVGTRPVYDTLKKILPPETGVKVQCAVDSWCLDQRWCRDLQVVCPTGATIVPSPCNESCRSSIQAFIAPLFLIGQCKSCGRGLANRKPTISTALEGGNVKWFRRGKEIGAFVGASSVFLSALTLEDRGILTEKNVRFFSTRKGIYERILEHIAKDLNIKRENLLILAHKTLHIDLEMMVGPENIVFLQDPDKALEALTTLQERVNLSYPRHMYESDFTKLKEALKEYKKSGMFEFNKRAVEAFGFRAVGVPGYFDWRSLGVSGQFLNGLLLEDRETKKRFLITNSATTGLTSLKPEKGNMLHSWNETHLLHELAAVFSREMKKHDIDVVYVNTENARGGGLHCLSKEERDDWSGALHAIPVKSQALPATVSTILQIEDMRQNSRTKEPIELCIKTSPDSDADTRTQAVLFDQWSPTSWSCKQNVPIDKPLIVFLKIGNKKTQEYSFLPGHPLLLSVFSPSST